MKDWAISMIADAFWEDDKLKKIAKIINPLFYLAMIIYIFT